MGVRQQFLAALAKCLVVAGRCARGGAVAEAIVAIMHSADVNATILSHEPLLCMLPVVVTDPSHRHIVATAMRRVASSLLTSIERQRGMVGDVEGRARRLHKARHLCADIGAACQTDRRVVRGSLFASRTYPRLVQSARHT